MQTTSAIRIGPGHPVWDALNDPDVRQRLTALIKAALGKGTSPAAQQGAEWDEVLSDVCERALRIADHYDPTRKPVLYWLGGIAFVVMRERRPRRLASGVDVSTSPDPADPIPEAVLSRLEASDLVRRLPGDVYQLLLWVAEGRTAAEIAPELGISAGVSAYVSIALGSQPAYCSDPPLAGRAHMTNHERQRELDRLTARFLAALDAGDLETAQQLWNQSADDPEVSAAFTEAAAELVGEANQAADGQAVEIVEAAFRRAMPAVEMIHSPSRPLTVGEVAEHLRRTGVPGLSAAEFAINDLLAKSREPLPEQLGLSAITAWGNRRGSAPRSYWKAFREAALMLRLRRESAGEYHLAARAQRPKRPGGSQ